VESDAARRDRFEQLFCAHYGRVLAYAQRRARPDVAQDVVAQTFLVAWRRLDDIPREQLPWLYGVARRVLANELRAGRRRAALARRAAAEPFGAVDDEQAPVLGALARLRPRDRELLLLIAWEGVTLHDAARALGCSPATVRVRLHRARRRLAVELERDDEQVSRLTPMLEEQR
jgi:RNA polymerase sigma-70 factor, ECF subfamily